MADDVVTDRTERLVPGQGGVARAAALLREGRLVAFPTETVYGLGADARNGESVAAIYEAKGRPSFNPLIVHVASLDAAMEIADIPPMALLLAEAHWPGPLTLVAPLRDRGLLSSLVTAGLDTVGVRVPAHPVAHRLLREVGGPVAAPSANPSGRISATTAEHVMAGLGGRIAAVLDGGPCAVGVESTIVGVTGERPVLLRPGGLSMEQVAVALGRPISTRLGTRKGGPVNAPGQLDSHYAPAAALRLDARAPEKGEGWLGFGPDPDGVSGPSLNLSPAGDLREAAANLFAHLHVLDAEAGRIAVARIPDEGLGEAINDRLRRAAAPR